MGIAFRVLYPLLYSDVTDAWRLRSAQKRLQIDAAGMAAELTLAGFATFMWSFLPDGSARDACFFVAAVSWVLGLAINLNPFMKFDGYYIFSDWLGISNLQARSSALGVWWLRRVLFDVEPDKPEPFSPKMTRTLVLYAYCMWIYRLFLFIGIALLVYHLTFKALGIILFVIEIVFFIALPVLKELSVWWRCRKEIMSMRRARLSLGILALLAGVTLVPFSTTLRLPAVVRPVERAQIFPPDDGVIEHLLVKNGDHVVKGQEIANLTSRSLEYEVRKARARVVLARFQTTRPLAEQSKRSLRGVWQKELKTEEEALDGFNRRINRMQLHAPIDGMVDGLADGLADGDTVNNGQMLMRIEGKGRMEVVAYLNEEQALRWQKGSGRFVPDILSRKSVDAEFIELDLGGLSSLPHRELAALHGGSIPVEQAVLNDDELQPKSGLYRAKFLLNETTGRELSGVRGVLHIKGKPASLANRIYRQIVLTLLRESSF